MDVILVDVTPSVVYKHTYVERYSAYLDVTLAKFRNISVKYLLFWIIRDDFCV